MSHRDRPLLAEVRQELAALASDAQEMLRLRGELARRELLADARSLRRLALSAAVAAVMALTALPLLVVAAAWGLDGWLGVSMAGWLVGGGLVLLAAAAAIGWLAWRRFRRDLVALAETIEELREDLVWLRQWTGKP